MRIRVPLLFTGLLCLTSSAPAKAQYGWEKWEVAPFVGFETSGSVPVTNSLTVDRLRVNSGTSFGTFLDYKLTENAQAELMWNRKDLVQRTKRGHRNLFQSIQFENRPVSFRIAVYAAQRRKETAAVYCRGTGLHAQLQQRK
jgi:hypothetical protein